MSEKPEVEVDGKDLLQRGLDAMFNRLGDAIHGATKKETGKAKDGKATKEVIEAEGSESSPTPSSQAPSQEKRA